MAVVALAGLGACSSASDAPETRSPATPEAGAAATVSRPTTMTTGPSRPDLDVALIAAAWDNDVERAGELIAAGADVNAKDDTQQSAYLIATSEGYDELLDLTLQHRADIGSLDGYNGTGLIRAAERGHARVVGRLLREGIDVNHVNRLGWTALHEAIILGEGDDRYVDTVRLLVAGGADLELPSADGVLPLVHAENLRQTSVVATLKAALASKGSASPNTDLLAAAARGDADSAAIALRHGADIETRDERLRTPLLLASANAAGRSSPGANGQSEHQRPATSGDPVAAVTDDHVAVARLLVALGADPNAVDAQHDTPWLVTGVTGSVAMVDVLLPAKPDMTLRNRYGGIAIIPASERGHVDYVRRVATLGMNINHVNDLGWTALLEAVILGDGTEPYQQIVQILLDAGADPEITDRNGVTALEHARSKGYAEIVERLS